MMINRKDTPAPFMQRADPPAPRGFRPTAQQSAPQTPQHKIKSQRSSKLQRPTPRETYLDGNARGIADEIPRDERISHDLSLTDNTRHSVVDNMLMSLNPEEPNLYSQPQGRPTDSAGSDLSSLPRSAHQPRHLHSSSTNSDYTFLSDDSPDRRSYQFGRGRRSNSSSNFQSALRRIDSVHADGETAGTRRAKAAQAQQAGGTEATRKGHARKGSKGSGGSSSIDYGQMISQHRMPNSFGRRSASFDHGHGRRGPPSASSSGIHAPMPMSTSHSQPILYNDMEAAPTPTVPGGPRRDHSPAFPPRPIHAPPTAPLPQRRDSLKSSKSYHTKKSKGETLQKETPVPVSSGFQKSRRGSKQINPLPGFTKAVDPIPMRQFSEPATAVRHESSGHSKDVPKERPGFFRRVFGSSRAAPPPLANDPNASQVPQTRPSRDGTRVSNRNDYASTSKLRRTPTGEDIAHPPSEAAQPPLVKKPSSFFRRRKKSVSEVMPPPMLPPHLQAHAANINADRQRSPVSSLRKVMNPYLDTPVPSQPVLETEPRSGSRESDAVAILHSNIRPRRSFEPPLPHSAPTTDAEALATLPQARDRPLPSRENPNPRTYLNPDDGPFKPGDNSFLHDDSSIENRTPEADDSVQPFRLDPAPTRLGATSVRTDMRPRRTTSKDAVEQFNQTYINPAPNANALSPRDSSLSLSARANDSSSKKIEAKGWLGSSQATPTRTHFSPPGSSDNPDRVWLQPVDSNEDSRKKSVPIEGAEISPVSDYHSASSSLHPLRASNQVEFPEPNTEDLERKLTVEIDPSQPSVTDRTQARLVFEGDESIAPKAMAAAWLGEPGSDRARIRKAYMEMFDWQNLNILAALRGLCGRLYLKGEAQQVDRILDAFSTRWCACNPLHGFKATDVVHTICYSVLLLNTDLHQAEIEPKMTRTQFLKNILPTVRRVVTDAAPDAFVNARASTMPPARSIPESSAAGTSSMNANEENSRRSFEGQRPVYRLIQRPSDHTAYTSTTASTPIDYATSMGDCGPLVKTPFHGKLSTWENQVEIVLKDFFNSIRQQPLPLHGSEAAEPIPEPPQSATSLSAMTGNMLRRTPSMLSKAGSEKISYSRGRPSDSRLGTGRWQSKTRSRPRLHAASTVASSRRSSLDEQSSVTSPSVTSAWSKFSSLGKTQTTLSINSFASNFPEADYQQSIGFANALSQAIIREEGTGGDEESLRAAPLLEDENLELAGAPWAKEGILKHKHHLESVDKKAKDRNWVESFAVIEKGYMRLFSFSMNAKSLRQKAKNQRAPGGVVGGGNWADSAEILGSFVLRQTIASALPPPGYSKARPHVWALSLPTGAVHLFQVGTPEIVKEFVTTANYWSARLSKEPMVGGISNIEYGWGDSVVNIALINHSENTTMHSGARPSLQSSIRSGRSSMEQGSVRPRLPGDKIAISDWTPPQQSLVASALMEVDQLKALLNYVKSVEEELQKHNELRGPMLLAFSPRHPNHTKAMSNWERKSSYLLREIVKFRTYIDCLQTAQVLKEKFYRDKENVAPTGGVEAPERDAGATES